MSKNNKMRITIALIFLLAFVLWTILVMTVDVQPAGTGGTNIGFATVNTWFHELTGVHLPIYNLTDYLSVIPFVVCIGFGVLGLVQLFSRRSLLKVDKDIVLLGCYYILVILCYLLFEKIPINYRPILIEGVMEVSYPSSTTLLVLSVMPTLIFQMNRRANPGIQTLTAILVILFSGFMVIGRLISGVHWLTDIIGGVLLSAGLFLLYRSIVMALDQKSGKR